VDPVTIDTTKIRMTKRKPETALEKLEIPI